MKDSKSWRETGAGVGLDDWSGAGGEGEGDGAFNEKPVAHAKALPDVRLVTVLDKTYLIMDSEMCLPCKQHTTANNKQPFGGLTNNRPLL